MREFIRGKIIRQKIVSFRSVLFAYLSLDKCFVLVEGTRYSLK